MPDVVAEPAARPLRRRVVAEVAVSRRRFDLAWHVSACRELVRVSVGEVRIHPVCGADGRRDPEVAALRAELDESGIASEVVPVNYEFFVGSGSMLVLKRGSS